MRIYRYAVTALLLAGLYTTGCASKQASGDGHTHAAGETCDGKHDHGDHDHAAEGHDHAAESTVAEEEHDHTGVILLDTHQEKELGLGYETAHPAPFATVIRTAGTIEGLAGDRSTVVATASGVVSFGGRQLTEGSSIAKGAPFITLKSDGMSEGNYPQQLANAQAELAKAEADLARAEPLEGKVVTAAEVQALRLAAETARRQVAVLSRNTTSGGKSIVAPLGGYLTSLLVSEGDYVTAGQPLAVISANQNLVLRADVPQRYAADIPTVRSARFTTPYDGRNYDLAELNGRLIGSGRAVNGNSPMLPVRFEFSNRNSLTPGSVVEVYLQGTPREQVLSVPLSALTEEQGAYFLYVRTAPEHYVKKPVRTGTSNGSRIEITQGIAAGDEVVTEGAFYVRLASMSNEIPHGHTH